MKLSYKMLPKPQKLDKVTRVEVVDGNGRSYVNWDSGNIVELSFQDDGKTLKVFINNRKDKK